MIITTMENSIKEGVRRIVEFTNKRLPPTLLSWGGKFKPENYMGPLTLVRWLL